MLCTVATVFAERNGLQSATIDPALLACAWMICGFDWRITVATLIRFPGCSLGFDKSMLMCFTSARNRRAYFACAIVVTLQRAVNALLISMK